MIHILKGDNFSGRSHYLKTHTFYESENLKRTEAGFYLGVHPANYITGLFSTCEFEIKLHNKSNVIIHRLDDLIDCTNFRKFFKRNPFTLSGGEQVLLSIISGLNMEAYNFAVDSTLEQLSQYWRQIVLNTFESDDKTNYLIADNRSDEFITGKNYQIIHSTNTEIIQNPIKIDGINFNESIRNIYSKKPIHVSIKNINFAYDRDIVLNNLSIDFEPGKIYHLSGENGAGKSTFSKILTGILKPNAGSIKIDGKETSLYYTPGRYFGYSFQNPDDQIFENSILRELSPQTKAITDLLFQRTIASTFGLADLLNYHPSSLPFPIRKAVSLAGTLAVERPWYIFDEPTVGLDNRNVGELIKIFKTLSEIGKGIIVVSHSENFPKSLECIKLKLSNGIITS